MFHGILSGSGFELQLDTANEVLMRINRSLDPEPLTDGMWASYVAIRRELRYVEYDRVNRAEGTDSAVDVGDLATKVNLRNLPGHVAKDFTFLLRIETLLRMWAPSARVDPGGTPPEHLRDHIFINLANETRHYLDDCEDSEQYQREVLDPVIRCLAKAARIEVP